MAQSRTSDELTFGPHNGGLPVIPELTEGQQLIPAPVVQQAVTGGDVDIMEAAPEARWADVPYLPKPLQETLVQCEQPFRLLYLGKSSSSWGPIWRYVMDLEGQVLSGVLSRDETYENRIYERAMEVLALGARSVGPFILAEKDTGKGNPYRYLKAVPASHQGKQISLEAPRGKK